MGGDRGVHRRGRPRHALSGDQVLDRRASDRLADDVERDVDAPPEADAALPHVELPAGRLPRPSKPRVIVAVHAHQVERHVPLLAGERRHGERRAGLAAVNRAGRRATARSALGPSHETFYVLEGELLFHVDGGNNERRPARRSRSAEACPRLPDRLRDRPLSRHQHAWHAGALLPRRRRTGTQP